VETSLKIQYQLGKNIRKYFVRILDAIYQEIIIATFAIPFIKSSISNNLKAISIPYIFLVQYFRFPSSSNVLYQQ